jgi:hypothetical protein
MKRVWSIGEVEDQLERWQKQADDIHPCNVDSMDRVNELPIAVGEEAVRLLPDVLMQLREYMISQKLLEFCDKKLLIAAQEYPSCAGVLVEIYEFGKTHKVPGKLIYNECQCKVVWAINDYRDYRHFIIDGLNAIRGVADVDLHYKNYPKHSGWLHIFG